MTQIDDIPPIERDFPVFLHNGVFYTPRDIITHNLHLYSLSEKNIYDIALERVRILLSNRLVINTLSGENITSDELWVQAQNGVGTGAYWVQLEKKKVLDTLNHLYG